MQTASKEIPEGATYPIAFLQDPKTSEVSLVDLSVPLPERLTRPNGLALVGTSCIVHGAPHTCLLMPLDAIAIKALAGAYLRHIEACVNTALIEAVEVACLQRLYGDAPALPN